MTAVAWHFSVHDFVNLKVFGALLLRPLLDNSPIERPHLDMSPLVPALVLVLDPIVKIGSSQVTASRSRFT